MPVIHDDGEIDALILLSEEIISRANLLADAVQAIILRCEDSGTQTKIMLAEIRALRKVLDRMKERSARLPP